MAKTSELVGGGNEVKFYVPDTVIMSLAYFGTIQNAFIGISLKLLVLIFTMLSLPGGKMLLKEATITLGTILKVVFVWGDFC